MEFQDIVQFSGADQQEKTVINVAIDSVITNPFQPRKVFDADSLQELSNSIKEYGVLQPLLVVALEEGQYLLIAGERRLRAAYLAGLNKVPVLLGDYNSQEIAEIAMIENLQREDLHFFDEAEGYELLMKEFNITQEKLAQRIGKKQSTVANKLRVLKLDKALRDSLRESNLTERHARALLKLEDLEAQQTVLKAAIDNELNVRQTEMLIETFLVTSRLNSESTENAQEMAGKRTRIIRDVRIFINSVKKVVSEIKKSGVHVKLEQTQTEEEVVMTMKIPLQKAQTKKNK